MNNFRIEKEAPNDRQRYAAWCRTIELEEYVVTTIDKNTAHGRDVICAANILANRRLKAIIASSKQDVFGYAPSKEDELHYDKCCQKKLSREVFESAAQLIRALDAMNLEHGYAMADEVTEAINKATRYILAGGAQ